MRIRRVASRQASRPLLIGLKVRRMLKRTSGLDKLMSLVHRMGMEFESKLFEASICRLVSRFTTGTQNYRQSDWSFLILQSLF